MTWSYTFPFNFSGENRLRGVSWIVSWVVLVIWVCLLVFEKWRGFRNWFLNSLKRLKLGLTLSFWVLLKEEEEEFLPLYLRLISLMFWSPGLHLGTSITLPLLSFVLFLFLFFGFFLFSLLFVEMLFFICLCNLFFFYKAKVWQLTCSFLFIDFYYYYDDDIVSMFWGNWGVPSGNSVEVYC